MNLQDTFTLAKTDRYANAGQTGVSLPLPYGTFSVGAGGVWLCPCIDNVAFVYCIADGSILSVASGNTVEVYVDGVLQSSGYTVTTSGNYQSKGVIAYIDFTSNPQKDVTVRCKGLLDVSNNLIETPLAILADIFDRAGYDGTNNATAWAEAERFEAAQGYLAAGVIIADRSLQDIVNEILSSFLGRFWIERSGELTIEYEQIISALPVRGILAERDFAECAAERSTDNIINQVACRYAQAYINIDRRTTTGVGKGAENFFGDDDGAATADLASQNLYGVRLAPELRFYWVHTAAVVTTLQTLLLDKYAFPVWLLSCVETTYRNLLVEKGQYVAVSWRELCDENGLPLKNQIMRVLEIEQRLDQAQIAFVLQDTGSYVSIIPYFANGEYFANGSIAAGRERDRRDLA